MSEGQLEEKEAGKSGKVGPASAWETMVRHLDLIVYAKAKPLAEFKQGGDTICSSILHVHC